MTDQQRQERINMAYRALMKNEDFLIFLSVLQAKAGLFLPQDDPKKLAVQQFTIGLMGDMDLYTTNGAFYVGINKALEALPRSPEMTKPSN